MQDCGNHPNNDLNRREFLTDFGAGLGGLSLAALYGINPQTAQAVSPFAPKPSHFPVKAKAIIQLFASGAPSSVTHLIISLSFKRTMVKSLVVVAC